MSVPLQKPQKRMRTQENLSDSTTKPSDTIPTTVGTSPLVAVVSKSFATTLAGNPNVHILGLADELLASSDDEDVSTEEEEDTDEDILDLDEDSEDEKHKPSKFKNTFSKKNSNWKKNSRK